jgi:hypothetical protein
LDSYGQTLSQRDIDKDVIQWVESYLKSEKYYNSSDNIKGKYHVFLIQKNKSTSIYTFGTNVEPGLDFILVYKKDKTFKLVGAEKNLETDLVYLYNFFEQNNSFSEETKNRCYENIIQRIKSKKEQVSY